MLEVRDLSVAYGQHRALQDASLTVAKGEIVVILGANGAGKSTLLKAVAGICEGRVEGSVTLGGDELLGRKPDEIVQAGLALVPEGRGVFGDLTVQENLALGAYAERARDREAQNVERVMALFPKLAERRRQTVRTMSGGEQQMVAIGRAMMSSPEILALDEPSLGLSPLLAGDLFQSLVAVREAGVGVLLVEQNARKSLRIADRGYLLENGSMVKTDTAAALARDPSVQRAYLGAGLSAPRPAPAPAAKSRPAAAPRPADPSPADIAAAALRRVADSRPPQDKAAPAVRPPAPTAAPRRSDPAPRPAPAAAVPDAGTASRPAGAPDLAALVARADASASRRGGGGPAARHAAPPRRPAAPAIPTPSPGTASPSDRLRTLLEEIETAARRAETYRPGSDRR